MRYLFLFFLGLIFVQCDDDIVADVIVIGMSPRYTTLVEGQNVSAEPMEFDELINFIIYGDYLLLVERSKGIHIIDNINPDNPLNIAFIEMPGTVGVVAVNEWVLKSLTNPKCRTN